ncbi:MAG: IS4 family transposase, partial [Actinobacteria bacterium]|nr:IS4 family transposase [Actinomycetota bacterium]
MYESLAPALSSRLEEHTTLSRTRRETFVWLVILMIRVGTTSLWRLAAHAQSPVKTLSVHRRFERFFQHVRFDGDEIARLLVEIMGLSGKPWHLALDRTNWKFGRVHINILMLGVVHGKVCVPLFWCLLDKAGNSNASERTRLMSRLVKTFPDQKIACLTGDREFIGGEWMLWLHEQQIPFVLRLRENMHIRKESHVPVSLCVHARSLKRRDKRVLTGTWFLGRRERDDPGVPVKIALMRLKTGELLAVAASGVPVKKALAAYRGRWGIETLFSCMKSRGLGMEDTHMTDPGKLATLTAVLALAFVMAYKAGLWAARFEPPKNKAHGRLQKSLFALGLAALRKILAVFSPAQIFECFRTLLSTQIPRKSLICG